MEEFLVRDMLGFVGVVEGVVLTGSARTSTIPMACGGSLRSSATAYTTRVWVYTSLIALSLNLFVDVYARSGDGTAVTTDAGVSIFLLSLCTLRETSAPSATLLNMFVMSSRFKVYGYGNVGVSDLALLPGCAQTSTFPTRVTGRRSWICTVAGVSELLLSPRFGSATPATCSVRIVALVTQVFHEKSESVPEGVGVS